MGEKTIKRKIKPSYPCYRWLYFRFIIRDIKNSIWFIKLNFSLSTRFK